MCFYEFFEALNGVNGLFKPNGFLSVMLLHCISMEIKRINLCPNHK